MAEENKESVLLDSVEAQDVLDSMGFKLCEDGDSCFSRLSVTNHHINLIVNGEDELWDVVFVDEKTLFNDAHKEQYTIRYLQELEKLMIEHGYIRQTTNMCEL